MTLCATPWWDSLLVPALTVGSFFNACWLLPSVDFHFLTPTWIGVNGEMRPQLFFLLAWRIRQSINWEDDTKRTVGAPLTFDMLKGDTFCTVHPNAGLLFFFPLDEYAYLPQTVTIMDSLRYATILSFAWAARCHNIILVFAGTKAYLMLYCI